MRRVVLHIDVVLKGFGAEDRVGVREGLRAELARLLGTAPAAQKLAALRNVPMLSAGTISLSDATPRSAGAATAEAIVKGFSQ
jgi:hypothetical protein